MKPLVLFLLLKSFFLCVIILTGKIGLSPDEAQYWTWSQQLDWGYYSKPPGIAWLIGLTSWIFGNGEWGVRSGALLIGFGIPLAVYACARGAGLQEKTSFWAAMITAFCPLGFYLSFATTTDGGAILFLTLAVAATLKGIRSEQGPNYWLVGLCILFGALFKWTPFIFWPVVCLFLFSFKTLRKWSLLGGIALSCIALLPTFYWNLEHEWATFKHVGRAASRIEVGNFLDFFSAQIGLLSPVFLVMLISSYFFLKKSNKALVFAAGFPFLILIYLSASFFKKMQPNWAAYLYPPGLCLAAWFGCEVFKGKKWLHVGLWTSIFITTALFAIPWLQADLRVRLPYSLNPFRQAVGWNRLKPALEAAGYHPNDHFLFSDKYQTCSLLSFYGHQQQRAYFFNLGDSRKNQFSYWPQMQEREQRKTGYFVVVENTRSEDTLGWYQKHYLTRLEPYFKTVRFCGSYPLYSLNDHPVKYAFIFECKDYSGIAPSTREAY